MLLPIEVRIASVEMRHRQYPGCIEILSPVNKREPGLMPYRQKRQRLYNANVHLIEMTCCGEERDPLTAPSRNRLSGDGNSCSIGSGGGLADALASSPRFQFHCDRPMLMCLWFGRGDHGNL